MLYGAAVWDPLLIIAQITSIQCLWYLSLGLLQGIFLAPYVGRLSIAHVLDWRLMQLKHFSGWMIIVSNLANAPLGAVYLLWVVERAKKCLDFGTTCYILHLAACWISHGFPASLFWWGTNTVGMLVMALLGEWLCVRREMQDIPLHSAGLRGRAAAAAPTGDSSPPGTPITTPTLPAPAVTVVRTAAGSAAGRAGNTPTQGLLRPISISSGNAAPKYTAAGTSSVGGSRNMGGAVSRAGTGAGASRMTSLQLTSVNTGQTAATVGGAIAGSEQGRISRSNSRSRLLGPNSDGDNEV